MNFNMPLDDDIAAAVDADRQGKFPRRSRTAHIEAILYEKYKEQVDQLRAKRRRAKRQQVNAQNTNEAPDVELAAREAA